MKDYIQLCAPEERQQNIEFIVLEESNFTGCETNYLPMKIFRDIFLAGGVGFDVSSLFDPKREQQYMWLAYLILNSQNLNTLNNLPDLKK